jgi:pre-60S factor REI1
VALLPPITPEQYHQIHDTAPSTSTTTQTIDDHIASISTSPTAEADTSGTTDDTDDDDDDAILDPSNCLFCPFTFSTVSDNLSHMSATHGFTIPNLSSIQTDLETFVSYLSLVLNNYHECLHCGHVNDSAEAVRAHMIATGHCMLDLEEGSEFLDFWDKSNGTDSDEDQDRAVGEAVLLSQTELRLPSGVVATSRHGESSTASRSKQVRAARKQTLALATAGNTQAESSTIDSSRASRNRQPTQALALRSSMGLTGLSSSQLHSLAIEQRKIDLSAFRARNKAQWTLEKMGNRVKQKHFKVGSMCRSGLFIDPTMF